MPVAARTNHGGQLHRDNRACIIGQASCVVCAEGLHFMIFINTPKSRYKGRKRGMVWTSDQLDNIPSPTEGLRARGLATGSHKNSKEKMKVTSYIRNKSFIRGIYTM